MSYAKHSAAPQASDRAAALIGEHLRFCAELSDGLHALAQPLTILRSAIGLLALSKEADRRNYLELSVRQIDHTCSLFASIQNLVASRLEPAERAPIDLRELLAKAIEVHSPALRGSGIEMVAAKPESLQTVLGDRQRTEQTVSALFEAAVSASSAGDVIAMSATRRDGFLEFTIRSTGKQGISMKSANRLNLSLAKANIEIQQGWYDFAADPFRISFGLPVYELAESGETSLCATQTA
ncbi:MAG: hypothetical protein WBE72_06375 [Terracidiphilus sp.]